jgi:dienelactone hydrolase
MRHRLTLFLLLCSANSLFSQQQEFKIWPVKAPGSENWSFSEAVIRTSGGDMTFSNVVDPTLTAFLADPVRANGVAVIICPGGGMRRLSWKPAQSLAEYLNGKGITAFILKYRFVPDKVSVRDSVPAERAAMPSPLSQPELTLKDLDARRGNANPAPDNEELAKVIAMAIADGQQAIRMVRRNAIEYHVDPKRIGIAGFSAGGAVVVGTAMAEQPDAYPDFLVSLYGPSLVDVSVPKHGAPLFIAVGNNDFNVTNACIALFQAWKAAGKPAEMHIHEQAGGGLAVESWTDHLYDWLRVKKIVAN